MNPEEVMQHVQEPSNVLTVAITLSLPDTIDNHVPDFFGAVLEAQHGTGKAGCYNLGNAFVFRDDKHHFLGQAAERNAIFQRNHSIYYLAQVARRKMINVKDGITSMPQQPLARRP